MKKICFVILTLAVACCALVFATPVTTTITGDYVEARTASVFAGACHYNGEVVTTGRDAVMAWNIASGKWKGTDLSGTRVMAVVSADANLGETQAARRTEIAVDSAATEAQAAAAVEMLKVMYSASVGNVVNVRRAPIMFEHKARSYAVNAKGFAALTVEAMPNDMCCRMPNLVWYTPLVQLSQRKVGYTAKAYYAGGAISETWERSGENSAFYGHFSL